MDHRHVHVHEEVVSWRFCFGVLQLGARTSTNLYLTDAVSVGLSGEGTSQFGMQQCLAAEENFHADLSMVMKVQEVVELSTKKTAILILKIM